MSGQCGPDQVSWFAVGQYPRCACGYAPKDNRALIDHWRAQGFKVVDRFGTLVKVPIPLCSECSEPVNFNDSHAGYGMCASCLHDAIRSGWTPGGES